MALESNYNNQQSKENNLVDRELIRIRELSKTYHMGDSIVRALDSVSVSIREGEFVAIMGPSGSGKSTLMHMLGLLDSADSGTYEIHGQNVSEFSEDALAGFRAKMIGFVFQQFNLLPRTTALENVSMPLLYSGEKTGGERAKSLLQKVGLGERLLHHPNELSGGQQQRVAIARGLINAPKLLLADEPTGNLDSTSEREILSLLRSLNEQGITVIIVTHEENVARAANRIIRMRDGRIVADEAQDGQSMSPTEVETESEPKESKQSLTLRSYLSALHSHANQAAKALLANKIRSGLSMLGILIGVAAVVAMLAIGQGAKESIEKELSSLGSNLLVLMPGSMRMMGVAMEAGSVTRFTADDAEDIAKSVPFVKRTSSSVSGRVQAVFGNKNWSTSVTGAAPEYATLHASSPQFGRFFNEEENLQRARVVVLGTTVVRNLFGNQNPIGEFIKLNRVSFQVIGVLKSKGAQGFRDQDDVVLVPLMTGMRRLLGKDYVDQIDIEVSNAEKMPLVEDKVRELIIRRHRISDTQEESFQVRNMAEIQQALGSTSRILSALLALIAAISLLVGGIGIMNIMMVSVTERTKEIGLRKAVGAKRRDILTQFLVEAIVISALGGIGGIAVGWTLTSLVSALTGWATSISMGSVILALIFSSGIGVVFGLWPAQKAAKLSPMNALRYE